MRIGCRSSPVLLIGSPWWQKLPAIRRWKNERPFSGPLAEAGAALKLRRLGAGRRSGRAEDPHAVTCGDREQSLHVRGSLERRRQHTLCRRLADPVEEALEGEGLEADQRPRAVRLGDEGVRDPPGAEGERARRERKPPPADVHPELPFERVEPPVL